MAIDINQILSSSGNMVELVGNLTRSLYFWAFILLAFTGKLFSLFISFFIGKYKRGITHPVYYIPFILDLIISILILILLLAFPEVLSWIGGIK